jgi:crossover junction endodeoxyribonuclease RuvC
LRILGIDPGSRSTGYGVVEHAPGGVHHRAHGTLRPPANAALAARLAFIQTGLADVIAAQRPEVVVVERVFVSANVRSALVLGQARGAALAAAGLAGIGVDELTAQEIKQAVVGTGRAEKAQVQRMVATLLGLDDVPPSDAADALAAALCRAHQGPLAGLALRGHARARRSSRPLGPRVRRLR